MQSAANRDLFCQPDVRRALELVLQLMPIAGRSGQEGEVAEFVRRELRQAGVAASALQTDSAHRRTPGGGQTGNLILSLPGTVRAPRRMLSAHLDTVPICVGCEPQRHGDLIRSANPNSGLGAGISSSASTAPATPMTTRCQRGHRSHSATTAAANRTERPSMATTANRPGDRAHSITGT